jgi:hypothetical protein
MYDYLNYMYIRKFESQPYVMKNFGYGYGRASESYFLCESSSLEFQ